MPEVLKRVGRFDLLEIIGRGGAAVVYLALQRDLQRHVALKELSPFHLADSSFAERFVEESRLAGSMSHANVVTVHEYFEDGGVPYIAMEYLPNGSLRQYIGRLTTAQIAGVMEGVLAGLAHGEAHGIVHRDLKPENLLVSVDGRVKIADFGVARAYSKAATRAVVTVSGTTIGTPAYMSPEQALGTDLTPATDLYSLGVVAWEMLTGRVPFEETDTPVAVLYRHVHEDVPSVRSVAPDVDPGIAAWLGKMLAKRPEDRFQSADAAWVELEDVVLELLGPRWRREARLPVSETSRQPPRTLTPAPFDTADPDAASPFPPGPYTPPPGEAVDPDIPVPQTVTGPAAEPPAGAALSPTVAPSRRPPSHTTIFRLARRHTAGEEAAPERARSAARRRLAALGIVLAMAAAAVAGVLIAQPSRPAHHGLTAAQRRVIAQRKAAAETQVRNEEKANRELAAAIKTLAIARNRGLTAVRNVPTSVVQARVAAGLQHAYVLAAAKAQALSGKTPVAKEMATTLTATAGGFGRAADAARHHNVRKWNRAWAAALAGEARLRSELKQF